MKKLVRDRIPELAGQKAYVAKKKEYERRLGDKLVEEALEFQKAKSYSARVEELADVLQVVDALSEFYNIDEAEIEAVRKEKLDKKGGFELGFIMKVEKKR
jgi:predicted house-cleaning noncanonical NTP pyrophosphatase (MazG superfamily)